MRYAPKELKENVNISKKSPLKEFFILLGAILGMLIIIYIGLGFAVDIIVERLPPKIEYKLAEIFSNSFKDIKQDNLAKEKLQHILNGLVEQLPPEKYFYERYNIYIVDDSKVANALAYPGGNIVIFSALIKEAESENELAFVLAHELGHFANRDHLRGLGRSLVLFTMSAVLFGDNTITNFLRNSLVNAEMKFSQHQESMADVFALELLNKTYGHVAGATDFFNRISKKERIPRFLYFFATHPYTKDRIQKIKGRIQLKGYLIKDKLLLDEVLNNLSDNPTF